MRKEAGFTFIELLITMAVVVLALLGFIAANLAIQQTSESAFQRTIALQDANQVIEQMRNAAATGNFPANVTAVYPNGAAVGGFSNLTGEAVTVAYANPLANPLDTAVTVTWLQNGTRQVNTVLRTLITQRA